MSRIRLVSDNTNPTRIPRIPRKQGPSYARQHYKPGHEFNDWSGVAIVVISLISLVCAYIVANYWDAIAGVMP